MHFLSSRILCSMVSGYLAVFRLQFMQFIFQLLLQCFDCLQCFDAVGWASGRASNL